MNTLKNNLEQREKTELIIIIQHMLRQEPDLQWLLATPLPGEETCMTDRLKKEDFVRLLTVQMNADEATATAWVDGFVETLYESFKAGKGVTLPGFGGFYVRPEPESWVFKFNPGQRLRALFGWSSTYTVEL